MAEITEKLPLFIAGLNVVTSPSGKNINLTNNNGEYEAKMAINDLLFNKDDVVDMGLPSGTLWAKHNIGATKETDYGWYFAWGERMGYENANSRNAALGRNDGFTQAAYDTTSAAAITTNLTANNDVAHLLLGGKWKMPSKAQYAELFNSDNTEFIDANGNVISGTDKRTTVNGVVGILLRSKHNKNKLFFPAAGYYYGTSLSNRGTGGGYWSSSVGTSPKAFSLGFDGSVVYPQYSDSRRIGRSVRAVQQ